MMDLIVLALLVCGVASEAPYAPSGWKPNGPAFELPDPRNRTPQKQEYLPPNTRTTSQEYGPPEVDVSVQGLPTQEQLPIFQLSPVNGQQYVGPRFNNDLRNLEHNLRNSQLQEQQRINREFARQRELDAAFSNANRQNQPAPRQLALNPTSPKTDDVRTTTVEATTEALKLNQGEVENGKDKKENVSVEVSRQNIQEYPPELFLTPLAQLQLQNQYNPVQLGQLRAPIYLEPSQNYQAAQLQALPAYLAQQQLLQAQLAQTQAQLVQAQAQLVQPLAQAQPQLVQPQVEQQGVAQSPAYLVPEDQAAFIPQQQGVPVQYQPANQYAPANQYDTAQVYPQQPIFLQPQENQLLPRPKDPQVVEQDQAQQIQPQSQFVYQYQQPQLQQPQYQQPQLQQPQLQQSQYQQPQLQQPQYQQTQLQQPQYQQPQLQQPQYQQPQYQQPQYQQPQYQQPQYQIQYQHPLDSYQQDLLQPQIFVQDSQAQQARQPNSLQSGFNVNQQGNGLEEDKDEEQDDGSTATAVATAFGTRTQPRTSYGAPNAQAKPGYHYRTTEEATTEVSTEDGPAIAEATAVSKGSRPAKQRSRQGRVRPVFTLDRSGHLVLAQDQ